MVDRKPYNAYMLSDTSPEIEQLQIEKLRAATPAERLQTALNLSDTVIWMSRQAIARLHPEWDDRQVKIEFARIHYGNDVANMINEVEANR